MSALKLLFEGTTAQDNHITSFPNIFNEDYKVYELHFDSNGGNNGEFTLEFLTEEGVPLSDNLTYSTRFIYSHTSTGDTGAGNQKQISCGMGSYKYSIAICRVFNPFAADEKTTSMTMHMGYSSTSVVTSVPTYGIVYQPCRITGVSIVPEYSLGNAGTLRVYGIS